MSVVIHGALGGRVSNHIAAFVFYIASSLCERACASACVN